MPRVRPRKQPCDCERCIEEPVGEVESIEPALIRSLVICVSHLPDHHNLGGFEIENFDRLVQQGCSGTLYFAKGSGKFMLGLPLASLPAQL